MSKIKNAVQLATALQVYAQKDLQKTLTNTNDVNTLLTKAGLRGGSFDLRFPALFSFHGIDIIHTLNSAVADKEITRNAADYAKQGMYNAIAKLADKYPVLEKDKWLEIESKIEAFAATVVEGTQIRKELTNSVLANMRERYNDLKSSFNKAMLVSYVAHGEGLEPSIKIVHNSFSNFRDTINKAIKVEVLSLLKQNKVTNSKLLDSNFLTTKILNWGHTRVQDSIISGKLIASLISLQNISTSNDVMEILAKDFIQETGQINTEIKLHRGDLTKGDKDVLSLVIKSNYLQKVIVQYVPYNQSVLSQQEARWNLVDAIKRNPILQEQLGITDISQLPNLLINMKSSPNALDRMGELFMSVFTGKKPSSKPQTKPLAKFSQKVKVKSKKVSVKLKPGTGARPTGRIVKISDAPVTTNLSKLLLFINSNLQKTIEANMGDGSRRDILNLRSGRFAESVKVERLSESRQGMITAFYTYMKNPYATFSEGGRQQSPRSRDPKLLISKSIREIAAQEVANRMRAVLV